MGLGIVEDLREARGRLGDLGGVIGDHQQVAERVGEIVEDQLAGALALGGGS